MKKLPNPKRHHFVPAMHLRNFTDGEGLLFCFERQRPEKGIQRRNPDNVFYERHLYSQVDLSGKRDASLEVALGQFEGYIKPLLDKLIWVARNGAYGSITPSEIDLWLDYFYLQGKRTPDALKDNLRNFDPNEHLDEVFAEARLRFPKRHSEIAAIDHPAERKRMIKNATVTSISRGSRTVSEALRKRGIAIVRITNPGRGFVLGSHPVVKMQSNDIRDMQTEMWLPIAPDVAVGLGHANGKILALELAEDAAIRRMNVAITGQSMMIAAHSRELIKSLARYFGHRIE